MDKDSEAWLAVLDSLHSSSDQEEYQRILYTGSPEMQEAVGAEVRRGQSPAPEAPLSFLKDMDSDLRKQYPWLNKISGALGTRPQDRPPPQDQSLQIELNDPGNQRRTQQAASQANTGIAALPTNSVVTGPEVLRNQEISKLVRGFNKGGIVNVRRGRQTVM